MVANELTFAVLALVVLLAIAFFAVYRKTGTVTVGAIDLYLCLHNLKYIILLRLSPFFYYSSILFDTPPIIFIKQQYKIDAWLFIIGKICLLTMKYLLNRQRIASVIMMLRRRL